MSYREKRLKEIADEIRLNSSFLDSDLMESHREHIESKIESLRLEAASIRCAQNDNFIDITKLPKCLRHLVKRF